MLDNLIEIVKLGENTYLLKNLLKIRILLKNNPNDQKLGEQLRKLLQ